MLSNFAPVSNENSFISNWTTSIRPGGETKARDVRETNAGDAAKEISHWKMRADLRIQASRELVEKMNLGEII